MSRRTERVGHLIRNLLADAIRTRLSDPRIERLTSITRVEVSADLSSASVYVSIMAPEPRQKLGVEALRGAAGRLRAWLRDHVELRQVPTLHFRLDESLKRGIETVEALDRLTGGPTLEWEADAARSGDRELTPPSPEAADADAPGAAEPTVNGPPPGEE